MSVRRRWSVSGRIRLRAIYSTPVPVSVASVATFATLVYGLAFPGMIVYINAEHGLPRPISPYEYAPIVLGTVLTLCAVSRLPDLDAFGGTRIRVRSAIYSLTILVLPCLISLLALQGYPASASPPASTLVICLNNVLFACCLVQILVLWCGRTIGLVLTAAGYAGLVYWQNVMTYSSFGPLALGYLPTGTIDYAWRPLWLIVAVALALGSAILRRMLPVGSGVGNVVGRSWKRDRAGSVRRANSYL